MKKYNLNLILMKIIYSKLIKGNRFFNAINIKFEKIR